MKTRFFVTAACLLLASVLSAQQVGRPLPPWTPGTLDIHQISTGMGNAALLIFPDGTSLLVDAGDFNPEPSQATPHPDASRQAGEWIARYVRHMLAHDANPAIDYALITHLHQDHLGAVLADSRVGKGGFKIAGLSEVAESIPIHTVLDRAWPDYSYPAAVQGVDDYRTFLNWHVKQPGFSVERFSPGRADQIALRRDPNAYPTFQVRNIAANGEFWTGSGTQTRQQFPSLQMLKPEEYPAENTCSAVVKVSYGRFDFYTGGDLTGYPDPAEWADMETAIAPVVGRVEVAVLNHHGMHDATNPVFLRTLSPQVVVIPSSNLPQPDFGVIVRLLSPRMLPKVPDIFATNLLQAQRTVLQQPRVNQLKSTQGHIVIRVAPGGNTYRVFVLDDAAETYSVKAAFGPYTTG